jgi:chromosome partitioning protein
MKTITFGIQKGGTGKTSVSASVAAQLALNGKKTLFIDGDPQGNATGWILKELHHEFADALFEKCAPKDVIHETGIGNLHIIPTAGLGGDLRLYGETKASQKPFAVKKMLPHFAQLGFEYTIIDTSPAFSPLEKQCFLASDEVIPVLQIDIFSTDGISIFTALMQTLRSDFDTEKPLVQKMVLNAKDDRLPQQKILIEEYQKNAAELFLIPVDQGFKKSQGAGIFIQEFAGTKQGTLDAINALAQAIL